MALNGKVFFDKLNELQYPGIHKFNPASFDWLFDNEEALPFLNWFCSSVQSSNLLTNSELLRFEELKESGITVLEGKRLTEALANLPDEGMETAATEAEIENLKRKKESLSSQKQNYIKQLNLLNYRKQKIGKSTLQYEGLKGDSQIHEEKCAEKLLLHNAALNEARKCVEQISGKLASLSSKPKLLSNLSLEPFLAMEESYTTKLTTHANNEFDQNMGAMGQNSGSDMCAFVRVEDANFCSLDETSRSFQNWELNHFRKLLPLTEGNRISCEFEVAAFNAALNSARQLLDNLSTGKFPSTSSSMRIAIDNLDIKNGQISKEVSSLKTTTLEYVKKSTELRCSSIIIGDCSLKLLRQEMFISKQKEFLSLMARQWAREQLLSLALRLEGCQLETALSTVTDFATQLKQCNNNFLERSNALKLVIDSEKSLRERNTIPSNDVVSRSLLSVLASDSQIIISNCEDLTESAIAFKKEFDSTALAYDHLVDLLTCQRQDLEKLGKSMENLIFGEPITSVTQTLMRSDILEKKFSQLDTARETVQSRLKPLYRDFKAKQTALKNDHLAAYERRLWALFYTDTSSMLRKTEALNAKATAF